MGQGNVLNLISQQVSHFLFHPVKRALREQAKVVAVMNLKGGCGKSTIAVNLACELAGAGDPVLLLDNDSQGTASQWIGNGRLPIRGERVPLENAADSERLVRAIASAGTRYVVLDAPAHVGAAALATGRAADLALIPVTASAVDLSATQTVLDLIRQVRALRRDGGPQCLIVPSKIDRRTGAGRQIEEHLAHFGEPVSPAIHQRAAFADAFGAGKWIGDFAPQSAAHYDISALAVAVKRTLKA
jgi:chromosome partitioning protein